MFESGSNAWYSSAEVTLRFFTCQWQAIWTKTVVLQLELLVNLLNKSETLLNRHPHWIIHQNKM